MLAVNVRYCRTDLKWARKRGRNIGILFMLWNNFEWGLLMAKGVQWWLLNLRLWLVRTLWPRSAFFRHSRTVPHCCLLACTIIIRTSSSRWISNSSKQNADASFRRSLFITLIDSLHYVFLNVFFLLLHDFAICNHSLVSICPNARSFLEIREHHETFFVMERDSRTWELCCWNAA